MIVETSNNSSNNQQKNSSRLLLDTLQHNVIILSFWHLSNIIINNVS